MSRTDGTAVRLATPADAPLWLPPFEAFDRSLGYAEFGFTLHREREATR